MNDYIWKLIKVTPVAIILWHIYLIFITDPGFWWIAWWLDIVWILLFFFCIPCLKDPTPGCFIYVSLVFFAYIATQAWNSYLRLDEWRLLSYALIQVVVLILFYHRTRFEAGRRGIALCLAGLVLINVLLGYWTYDIVKYKAQPAAARWAAPVTTKQVIVNDYVWIDNMRIAGRSLKENRETAVIVDLSSSAATTIDEAKTYDFSTAGGGQWLGYKRLVELTRVEFQYIRYDLLSGKKEVLFTGYEVRKFPQPMSPQGSPIVYDGKKIEQMQPDVTPWKREAGYSRVIWSPAGDSLLVLEGLRLAFYTPTEEQIEYISLPQNTSSVRNMQFSPNGQQIYLQVEYVEPNNRIYKNRLCYLDLKNPADGWHTIIEVNFYINNWSAGPDGAVVFCYLTREPNHLRMIDAKLPKTGIWLYDPEVNYPVRLTTGSDFQPAFSPDGSTISFLRAGESLTKPYLMLMKRNR